MLVDDDPDDRDLHVILNQIVQSFPIQCIAHLIVDSGQQLSQLNSTECDRLILSCRHWLCSNRVPIEEETRTLLMNVAINISILIKIYSINQNLGN